MRLITEILPPESLTFSSSGNVVGTLEIVFESDIFVQTLEFGPSEPKEEESFQPLAGGLEAP
jgi:hypothetical protein